MRPACLSLLASCLLIPSAFAAVEPKLPVPLDPSVFVGILKGYKDCRAKYAEMDARIDAAGVRDGSYYRVPGFPYLRTDRFAASFANEVKGLDEVAGWTRRMREFDQEAREFEYQNLGLSEQEIGTWRYDLLSCGSGLATMELFEDANLALLRKMAVPGAEYRPGKATLAEAQRKQLAVHDTDLLKRFSGPLPAADDRAPLKLWNAKPVEDLSLIAQGYGNAIPDELGVPALIDSQWRAFAERHAPALWIESASDRDQPGMPAVQGTALSVDPARPRMHYQITFTRFGKQALAQINYFIWFKGSEGLNGDVDGLIWRVTLDARAEPLVYESVRASGRDHLWFPAQPLKRRARSARNADDGDPLFPQAEPISGPVALRIGAGDHALRRVVPLAEASSGDAARAYQLARYEEVFTLAAGDGRTRSLYDANGQIPGVKDGEQARLWGDRVTAAGALRALGRVPVTAIGSRHFDDADRLDRLFVAPATRTADAGSSAAR